MIGQERAKKILAVAVFNHYNRVRANLMRQQARMQREGYPVDGEERHHAEHHRPTLPQDNYTSGPIQGTAELVPAERISPYGMLVGKSELEQCHGFSPDSYRFPFLYPVASQQRAWLNPPTQVGVASRPLGDADPKSTAYDLDDAQDSTVYEKSNVMLIGPTGSGIIVNKHTREHSIFI